MGVVCFQVFFPFVVHPRSAFAKRLLDGAINCHCSQRRKIARNFTKLIITIHFTDVAYKRKTGVVRRLVAKTRLSELVEQAGRGETIVIAKSGTPVAKLVPLSEQPKQKIKFGLMKGEFVVPADFDAPLDEATLAAFEGRVAD